MFRSAVKVAIVATSAMEVTSNRVSIASLSFFTSRTNVILSSCRRNWPRESVNILIRSIITVRGGSSEWQGGNVKLARSLSSEASEKATKDTVILAENTTKFVTLAYPAPGNPFHYAFPVHNLELAKEFYGGILGCAEGRSSTKWQDYSLYGHQIVAHWVGNDYRCQDYYNPVDGDEVPVPHAGIVLTVEQFHQLADRIRRSNTPFIIEPHLRFQGQPGEQWTMFFKDPSGNNLEFKAMTTVENLFAKYNVLS